MAELYSKILGSILTEGNKGKFCLEFETLTRNFVGKADLLFTPQPLKGIVFTHGARTGRPAFRQAGVWQERVCPACIS